ncbi:MAG: response regulator transcription factor [Saprospiraceae bacterium]|nr:response regulator transcription factor [Saprospiraceae bacterium]
MTHILYVEDEPFLGKIVRESLESRDFNVTMCADGRDVMPAIEEFLPDICVLDVMLPGKDGFELAAEIKERHPQIPIIFLTAKSQTEDVLKGFQVGGNDYLKKPFSIEELIVRIQNLLLLADQKLKIEEQATYQFGSFRFDPASMELLHNGKVTALSHRENEVLKVLVSQSHQAVDRRAMLKKIWGDDSFFNSRNLDVYIKKLRDHLKEDPDVQIITLKGVGYRFIFP